MPLPSVSAASEATKMVLGRILPVEKRGDRTVVLAAGRYEIHGLGSSLCSRVLEHMMKGKKSAVTHRSRQRGLL